MTAEQFQRLVNHESGLLGLSETSSDIQDLLRHEAGDVRAADELARELVEVFLAARFKGDERFKRRLAKIADLEGRKARRT